jgi:hypothetical protein
VTVCLRVRPTQAVTAGRVSGRRWRGGGVHGERGLIALRSRQAAMPSTMRLMLTVVHVHAPATADAPAADAVVRNPAATAAMREPTAAAAPAGRPY